MILERIISREATTDLCGNPIEKMVVIQYKSNDEHVTRESHIFMDLFIHADTITKYSYDSNFETLIDHIMADAPDYIKQVFLETPNGLEHIIENQPITVELQENTCVLKLSCQMIETYSINIQLTKIVKESCDGCHDVELKVNKVVEVVRQQNANIQEQIRNQNQAVAPAEKTIFGYDYSDVMLGCNISSVVLALYMLYRMSRFYHVDVRKV